MDRIPVSTVLLTKNSARTLPAYLASMQRVDDIVVLDGGSTDGTLELLKAQSNCRVFPQDKRYLDVDGYITDFSAIRNSGYALAKHPWILCVDSDEEATPQLLNEVARVVTEGKPGLFFVRRTFTYNGRPIVSLGNTTADHIRLFHTDCVRGCLRPVHERLDIIPGSPKGYLNADLTVPLPPIESVRRKNDRYLRIEVRANKDISFGSWFRWILLRNLFAIIRRPVVMLLVRLIPKKGARVPVAFEWEQMRYSWLLAVRTAPWNSKTASHTASR